MLKQQTRKVVSRQHAPKGQLIVEDDSNISISFIVHGILVAPIFYKDATSSGYLIRSSKFFTAVKPVYLRKL